MIIVRSVVDLFPMVQNIGNDNDLGQVVNQVFIMTQTVRVNVIAIELNQTLTLTQNAYNKNIYRRVSNYLELHQKAVKPVELYVNNQLILTQTGKTFKYQNVEQVFIMNQTAVNSNGFTQSLTFTESVVINITRNININQTFQVNQGTTRFGMAEECN